MKNSQRPHIYTHKATMAAYLYSAASKEDWLLELCRVQSNDNDSEKEVGLTPPNPAALCLPLSFSPSSQQRPDGWPRYQRLILDC